MRATMTFDGLSELIKFHTDDFGGEQLITSLKLA